MLSCNSFDEVNIGAVIDSTDIDISIHILKYRYIDTHFMKGNV